MQFGQFLCPALWTECPLRKAPPHGVPGTQTQSTFPASLLQDNVLSLCQPEGALQARSPFLHLVVGDAVGFMGAWAG